MSFADERARWGRRPYQFVEIELDRCALTYSVAPCTAALGVTGDRKCVNSFETCQDKPNFDPAPFFVRFGEPSADAPRIFSFTDDGIPFFLPFLVDVDHSPGLPDPGESIGMVASLKVRLRDAVHHDIGLDKYVDERGDGEPAGPTAEGWFLRRLRARWPHYVGRTLRWYRGYISDAPTLADFEVREFVMERFEGPDTSGTVRITAKDPLKLADRERAQAPRPSQGTLAADLEEEDAPTTLDVLTPDPAEYPGAGTQFVRIGAEVLRYEGTTAITGGVRLLAVARAAPPLPFKTEREDHEEGDAVQLCLNEGGRPFEIIRRLLIDHAGIPSAWIDFAEWEAEHEEWVIGLTLQRLITEPEGIRELVDEIIQQTPTWGVWWDAAANRVRYRAVRPQTQGQVTPTLSDRDNLIAGSISVEDEPDRLRNEVQVIFGQLDPTKGRDEGENYRAAVVVVDADSQSVFELGQRRIKRIFARWHTKGNLRQVESFATRTLSSRAANLMAVRFALDPKDANLKTADFADLTTLYLIDELGLARTTRVQVIRATQDGEEVSYRAREDFFRTKFAFGRWAPAALAGLSWADATTDEREKYVFWAQADGTMSDGEDGKSWF